MRQVRHSAKNNSTTGNNILQNEAAQHSAFHLRKIGSLIRSIEEKSWKTELISYNETSTSFFQKKNSTKGTESYKMKQLSIRRNDAV